MDKSQRNSVVAGCIWGVALTSMLTPFINQIPVATTTFTCPPVELIKQHVNDYQVWNSQNMDWFLTQEFFNGKTQQDSLNSQIVLEMSRLDKSSNTAICQYYYTDQNNSRIGNILAYSNPAFSVKINRVGSNWSENQYELVCSGACSYSQDNAF